ncbi:MAG: AsmA family protein [Verrucomicrobia bacterium]|jgi:hypothetical protein|nr:AsmA family protein [Verrucomicrobiota bacterium]
MKKLLKIIAVLALVLVVAVLVLQLFLNRGLDPAIQKALPGASESLGLELGVGDASLNLFGGAIAVDDVSVGNPDCFAEPSAFTLNRTVMDVNLRALRKGVLEVSKASVLDSKLTLVRNQEGDFNFTEIQEALPTSNPAEPTEPAAVAETEAVAAPSEPFEMPKVQLNNLDFNMLLEFVDYKTTNPTPTRIGFDLSIDARNVTTFKTTPEAEWGTMAIKGSLRESPEDFAMDITAKLAPLVDLAKPSFTAEGNIVSINMQTLGNELTEEVGIASDSVDISLSLNVRDGAFVDGSKLVATLREAELAGDLKAKHDDVALPPQLSLTFPVSGTLARPMIYIQQAITVSILQNLANNPDYLLDNITVGGKSLRTRLGEALGGGENDGGSTNTASDAKLEEDVNDAIQKLGDLFK